MGKLITSSIPVGMIKKTAGSVVPDGYLPCDGSAVSRTTYAALFAIINTTYGAGDGLTTFNVPDMRGRVAMGDGTGSGLTARTQGQTLGEESHLLSVTEMPSHNHSDSGHSHSMPNNNATISGSVTGWSGLSANNFGNANIGTGSANIQNTGGGATHNNIQPSLVVKFVIRY